MYTIRSCGCKGIRSCLICEKQFNIVKVNLQERLKVREPLAFCIECKYFYSGWDPEIVQKQHPQHRNEEGVLLPGVFLQTLFLTSEDSDIITKQLDTIPWCISQSGRRKQNFGPKANFKKRKLQNGNFRGFPRCTKFIQDKFKNIQLLNSFQTIEQCTLEYDPNNGAHIDPHIDDCWIWGERVITVNCKGSSVLTLTLHEIDCNSIHKVQDLKKYNLDLVKSYEDNLIEPLMTPEHLSRFRGTVLRVPMPVSSLIILYGPARYQFEHCLLREDITERRVCLAYREFTKSYRDGGESYEQGKQILENALIFF